MTSKSFGVRESKIIKQGTMGLNGLTYITRARNNVPNVPDHGDRQSRLFADQIKIWPISSICPHFLEKILNMPVNTHLNRKFNFISNSSLNL